MPTTKKCLLIAIMLFLSIGSTHPGLTQENSGDRLAQNPQEDWKIVQSGVWQRELGEGEIETFVFGVPGFTWKIQDLGKQLQKMRADLRVHPTPGLRKAIANHRKATANARRALELAREAEARGDGMTDGMADGMVLPKAGCIDFAYDAAASHKTDIQGVWASANAAFRATCGSATGQAYTFAFAKTTVNGAETTQTVTDGPRSGASVSASAYASRNGGSPCESRAYAEMVSFSLSPSSYSKEVTHSACPAPPSPPQPPVADFSFACLNLACSFNGSASTGASLTYTWSFGDSSSNGSGITTSHFYPSITGISSYTATLTVTDSLLRQSSKSKTVIVNSDPLPAAHSYFTVAPCRVLDTRNTTILTTAQPRVVNIAGLCGIPSTATAVAFNATAVSPTDRGKLRFYPGDVTITNPAAWPSSVTFVPATAPRANSAVVKLATNGAGTLGIYPEVAGSPGQVHIVLDIQGYFSTDTSPATGAQGPLGFQTLSPCRVAWPSSPLTAGTVTNFTAQGVCGVPAGAAAVSLHAGVAHPATSRYLTLFPSNISTPGVSTLSFTSGISKLRNSALVTLSSTTPDFSVYFGSSAGATVYPHFDVNGYFKSDAPLKYYPIHQCRSVSGALLTTDTVRTFQIQGNCGVPVGAKAALVRLQVANPTSAGDLTVYPSDLPLSGVAVSTVTFDANEPELSMNTIVPLSTLADDLAASPGEMATGGTVALSIDVFGYFQ